MKPAALLLALMASPTEIQVSAPLKSMTPSRPDQQRRRGHRTARLRGTGPCRHDGPLGACAGPQHSSWAKPCGRQAGMFTLAALLLCTPAGAATVFAPGFIEECVLISAKDMARDAVERVDYCRVPVLPDNPFAGDLYAKVPEFVNEYPAPLATVASATVLDLPRRRHGSWQAGGTFTPSPVGVPPFFTVIIHEPPRTPETPVDEPASVPLPGAAWLFLAAIATLSAMQIRRSR